MAECGPDVKSNSEKLTDEDFYHWLKAVIAISSTGDGLKDYVNKTLRNFHEELLLKVYSKEQIEKRSFCSNCTLQNIPPFSSCLCYKFQNEIKKHHTHSIDWTDTDPSSWCTKPWEVAKCYLPKMYRKHSSVEDLDFHAVIWLMINLDVFGKRNKGVLTKARNISNDVRHAPTHSLNEQKMNELFHHMFNVLDCAENGTRVLEAKEYLHKLKADKESKITHAQHWHKYIPDDLSKNDYTIDGDVLTMRKHYAGSEGLGKEQRRKQFKADLLVFNKECYSRISLQPVFEEHDTQLFEYYVEQRMCRVAAGSERNKTPYQTISLQHILDQEPGQDIYLVSKAGGGKTVFCKWLAMLWCHAHDSKKAESKYITHYNEYIEAMKKYAFFFLINLRNSKADTTVDFMIQHQIMETLSHSASYTITDLQAVLNDENCLIVLDGLDEWTHPPNPLLCYQNVIPERNKRCGCTFLTTSRPWKFHMLNQLSSLTMHIELKGFDENASKKFITNALSNLGTENPENCVEKFQKAITSQRLDRFKVIPLTLSFLVCLWKENSANIGSTMTEIYCNLIALYLSIAECKHSLDETTCQLSERPMSIAQKLIASNDICNKYYTFLLIYGKLAFETFFDDQRENSLAFETTSVEKIIDNERIELGLKIGFLTEERQCKVLRKTFKLSFVHKTFQEFFAALYISSFEEERELLKGFDKINKACKSLTNVLTVSHFYRFLFGLCPKAAYQLSKYFYVTVGKDDFIYNFRRDMGSLKSLECYNTTVKNLQDLVVHSVEESRVINHDENVDVPIILEDIIIDEDFKPDSNYKRTLESLIRVNRNNIKSIKIREIKDTDAFKNILECLGGERLNPLVKIDCKCTFTPEDMDMLLHKSKNTLECFVIKGGEWCNDKWVHNYFSVPEKTCNLFQNLTNIEELYLRNITMPHVQLEALMQYIKGRESMKQIGLIFVKCDDHEKHEACVSLDLSRSDQLSVLELGELPLLDAKLNTQSLEACYIGEFYEEGVFATIMETVVGANKLECFKCGFLREERNVAVLLQTIPKLTRIKIIWLINLTLAQCSIELSRTMKRLESITLLNVLMQSVSVENIKTTLEELKQPVIVGIFSCGVSESEPEKFEAVKNRIKQSDKFRVLLDGIDENSHHEYMFESKAYS